MCYMSPDVEKRSMLTHLHDLHFYSEAWCHAVTSPRLAEAMSDLLGPNVELHHTTLHVKPPETGMPFPLHQDSPFYRHQGFNYVDAIIHLDDTSEENGGLRFIPGSHKNGEISHIEHGEMAKKSRRTCQQTSGSWKTHVPGFAQAGDVVAFSIYSIHGSNINRTDKWRRLVRVGYRDPQAKQIDGQSLGRAGLMVHGIRPIGALAPKTT